MALLWKFNSLIMSLQIGVLESSRAGGVPFLLDDYPGAVAAYSFRKLRSAYTGFCVDVQNITGTVLSIGFVNNVVDTTAILTFAGLSEVRISKFYDQSGNGNNANLASYSVAPIVVQTGGILVTDGGKIAANSGYLNLTNNITQNSSFAAYSVMSRTGTNISLAFGTSTANTNYINFVNSNGTALSHNTVNVERFNYTGTGRILFTSLNNSNVFTIFLNGVSQSLTVIPQAANGVINQLNAWAGIGIVSNNLFQENILYNTSQTANNTGIQNNINTYYTIF